MLSPRLALFLLFVAFPLVELVVLIKAGEVIGFWPTVGILFLAAVVGVVVVREQGMSMVGRIFATVQEGRFPLETMLDSYILVMAGCLLVAPGFISDAIGLLLLIPPVRRFGIRWVVPDLGPRPAGPSPGSSGKSERPIVIEGTFERIDEGKEDATKPKDES